MYLDLSVTAFTQEHLKGFKIQRNFKIKIAIMQLNVFFNYLICIYEIAAVVKVASKTEKINTSEGCWVCEVKRDTADNRRFIYNTVVYTLNVTVAYYRVQTTYLQETNHKHIN